MQNLDVSKKDLNITTALAYIDNNSSAKAQEILNELNKLKIFEIPEFIEWYFTPEFDYPQMKHYAETLNYLRLLIIEYLRDLSPVL